METLKALASKVKISNTYGTHRPIPEDFKAAHPWTVRLSYQGRQLTVPFYMGQALTEEPTAEEVLECLLSDASGVECARSFEDWASDLGFDPDSRKAERIYKACERIAVKLRRFLGEDFERFTSAER